jgi:hypothetical protein
MLAVAVAASSGGCGSSGSGGASSDASAEAAPLTFTGCNGPAPAGYTPPVLPTYSGTTCPSLSLTPSGTDAGYTPPENDIATTYAGTMSMRQFKLVTPSDLGPTERVPVIFLWFWLGASAQDFIDRAEVVAAAQQQRFIAVVPEKKGDVLFTWPFAATDSADRIKQEFQFFDDMLACVAARFAANVNASCIASAGVSAGALFTDQLAPARSNVIASFLSLWRLDGHLRRHQLRARLQEPRDRARQGRQLLRGVRAQLRPQPAALRHARRDDRVRGVLGLRLRAPVLAARRRVALQERKPAADVPFVVQHQGHGHGRRTDRRVRTVGVQHDDEHVRSRDRRRWDR